MAQHEERQKIFRALEEYRAKYNADYYCVILTPPEGVKRVSLDGSFQHSSMKNGEAGVIIEGIIEKEVFFKKRERKE